MQIRRWTKVDERLRQRIRKIEILGRRRDHILESPELDLEALRRLVEEYEEAEMTCAAAALRRRLEWYREDAERKNLLTQSRGRAPRDRRTQRGTKKRQKEE
jgi:hypothetical protein